MPPIVIDLVIAVIILGMTYALMSEGLWGSVLMFFNVLFAGILAFNFYEPLAAALAKNLSPLSGFADTLCLLGIFIVVVVLLRLTTETLGPLMVRYPSPVYHLGRIVFALAGSVVTAAILLLAYETAPVHKKLFGVIDYKYAPPFKMGLDRGWLGFFQYTTGQIFANYGAGRRDPHTEYGSAKVFDPRAEWLLNHQEARPYGSESILGGDEAEGASGGEGGGGGGEAPTAGGGGESRPGDPKIISPATGGVVIPN
jgi:uncharacterized membrane protein required for colicin V production